jgi:hypothetical protein
MAQFNCNNIKGQEMNIKIQMSNNEGSRGHISFTYVKENKFFSTSIPHMELFSLRVLVQDVIKKMESPNEIMNGFAEIFGHTHKYEFY